LSKRPVCGGHADRKLEDITLRAIKTLNGVDLIAAEDTRHTSRLLSRYHIRTPLISCHEHNEHQRTPELIEKIKSGAAVALVSDAGTPSVSDPGYRLVRTAVEHGLDCISDPRGVGGGNGPECLRSAHRCLCVHRDLPPKRRANGRICWNHWPLNPEPWSFTNPPGGWLLFWTRSAR
jgi:hypothetical protein